MKAIVAKASEMRLLPALIVGVVLLGIIIAVYPAQAGAIGRKVGMVSLGLWMGYVAYRSGFPLAPDDDKRTMMCIKAALMIGTALCLALAV